MTYLWQHPIAVGQLLLQHLQLTGIAIGLGFAIALPLAILITQYRWLQRTVLAVLGAIYTIPSLALIILLVPWLGLGGRSVVVAMVLYSQVILVRSLVAGIQSIDPAILDAARGMGMNGWQQWWWVQVPLLRPVALAGIRLATTVSIAIAAIGAKFGAGGLGTLLFDGIAQTRYDKIWAGTLVMAGLAIALHYALLTWEQMPWLQSNRQSTPPHSPAAPDRL